MSYRRNILLILSLVCLCFVLQGDFPRSISISRELEAIHPSVIRTAMISIDDFLNDPHMSISETRSKLLRKSLQKYQIHGTKTYKISLTKEEQEKLKDSKAAKEIKSHTSNFLSKSGMSVADFNLLDKGPFPFHPDFKNPCWFNAQHKLRCLPFFFLIGAAKAGTTDVYNMIRSHPDFLTTGFASSKEPHWFTKYRFRKSFDFDWYLRLIAQPLSFMQEPKEIYSGTATGNADTLTKRVILGDFSATTMWENYRWPILEGNILPLEPTLTTADYIHHLNSKTKIIAMLRNPISRLYSDYIYFDGTRKKGPRDFHRDVISSVRDFSDCFGQYSIRSCVYNPHLKNKTEKTNMVRIWGGIYYIHLLEWYRVFPKEQILVLRLEDYAVHRTETVRDIYDFLTLRNIFDTPKDSEFIKKSNSPVAANSNGRVIYKNSTILEETRYILYTFYKPFNQALALLLNDQSFDYGPY